MKNEIINPLKKQEEEMDRILFSKNIINQPSKGFRETKKILLQLMKELKSKNPYLVA